MCDLNDSLFVTKMLAMALLLHGGLLGGVGGEAGVADGPGEVLGPSRPHRRASSLLQRPAGLLTSSIYARRCAPPSDGALGSFYAHPPPAGCSARTVFFRPSVNTS